MAVLSILTWEDIAAAVAVTLSMIVVALFMTIAEKQNKETVQKRGKILGFKEFLELAEADKMKALVAEDPQYFFNILPFAFVMGFSEKWIKKFDSVITVAPSWYVGSGDLDGMSYSMIHMYSMMWLMNNNINSEIVMAKTATWERKIATIPGAVAIPLGKLRERISELDPAKETVVFCAAGVRANTAARLLTQRGFADVKIYPGGEFFYRLTRE